jgi:hypothetical protein
MQNNVLRTLFAAVLLMSFLPAPAAIAGFSPNSPYHPFPATISLAGGLVGTRVDDFGLGGILNLANTAPGSTDDQIWTGSAFQAEILSAFSHVPLFKFGYSRLDQPGFVAFDPSTYAYNGQSMTVSPDPGSTWTWAVQGFGSDRMFYFYSTPQMNESQKDQLLTYRITGPGISAPTWYLYWEDASYGSGANPWPYDGNYTDLVVKIVAAPEPAGLLLVGLFLMPRRPRFSGLRRSR